MEAKGSRVLSVSLGPRSCTGSMKERPTRLRREPASTPSLWTAIQGSETGTKDDPIPAVRGMEYEYGLYYKDPEDGKTYLCARTGEAEGGKVILQYLPHELIGQYFEEVPA
mgnify:CR=1 FL=1